MSKQNTFQQYDENVSRTEKGLILRLHDPETYLAEGEKKWTSGQIDGYYLRNTMLLVDSMSTTWI